ncbi:hypothetical protein VNO77_04217 [Canavalia gladiata]|uniref:Uncharacterized protein n=1 Tax=Canavalia gladiata TaxID=3824 RepID=A0AAN9MWZ7_CANGL
MEGSIGNIEDFRGQIGILRISGVTLQYRGVQGSNCNKEEWRELNVAYGIRSGGNEVADHELNHLSHFDYVVYALLGQCYVIGCHRCSRGLHGGIINVRAGTSGTSSLMLYRDLRNRFIASSL